jgi:ribosomal protein L24E
MDKEQRPKVGLGVMVVKDGKVLSFCGNSEFYRSIHHR